MRIGQCGLWIGVWSVGAILAAPPAMAQSKAPPVPKVDVAKRFDSIDERQEALRNEVTELREQVRELGERLVTLGDERRSDREAEESTQETSKQRYEEVRELVRGLYVESSGIKADVAQARQDVQAVTDSVESFRLSSGILVAAVIVLQVIGVGLTFRGRG